MIRYLKRKLGEDPELRDRVHETILYFLDGGLSRIREPKAFKFWLRAKAECQLIDRKRYAAAHPAEPFEMEDEKGRWVEQNPGIKAVQPNPDDTLFLHEALYALKVALQSLNSECRELLKKYIRLRFLGRKVKELAANLGLEESTLRTKIHRCYRRLLQHPTFRAVLEDYKDGPREPGRM